MMKVLGLALGACLAAGAAQAATTSFTLTITGNDNVPTVSLSNTGDTGTITALSITIGNTAYNFDGVEDQLVTSGALGFTLGAALDTNLSGGLRSDVLDYTFSAFDPGDAFQFGLDVDIDSSDTIEDYQLRMLPGGSASVTFADGVQNVFNIDLTPTTGNNAEPYTYSGLATTAPVPLPAALPLLLVGLGALGVTRRRRTKA